jgi:hypothetical protein
MIINKDFILKIEVFKMYPSLFYIITEVFKFIRLACLAVCLGILYENYIVSLFQMIKSYIKEIKTTTLKMEGLGEGSNSNPTPPNNPNPTPPNNPNPHTMPVDPNHNPNQSHRRQRNRAQYRWAPT